MRRFRFAPFAITAPYLLMVLFLAKAAFTAGYIVRPWDVPDEVGHFSYIKDLATGRGFPVLHETKVDEDVWNHFARDTAVPPASNWIAQHPPLYHVVMIPVYWAGSLAGESFWGSFYAIRMASAFLFALGILVLMRAFREAELPLPATLGLGLMVASVPNHTFLAAAVNHDGLVFLFGALVLYYWIRYFKYTSDTDLMRLGAILGLGGLIKYTFLVLYPPVLILVLITAFKSRDKFLKAAGMFLFFSLSPLLIWTLRNVVVLGEMLPIDTTGFQGVEPWEISWLEFGRTYPIFSILLRSYWGLLGWMGDGNMQVRWFQIYSLYQQVYTLPLILLLGLTMGYQIKYQSRRRFLLVGGIAMSLLSAGLFFLSGWSQSEQPLYVPLVVLGLAISGGVLAEVCVDTASFRNNQLRFVEISSALVFLWFLLMHFRMIYSFSVESGALQGTFGRYYLPLVGFMVVGFLGRGIRSTSFGAPLLLAVAIIYTSVELYIWLHEALPFFYVHG